MSDYAGQQTYFTKHLFRAGLQCHTKLYYYAHDFPQDNRIRPFLEHAGYNKHQLKKLVFAHHPAGISISGHGYNASFQATKKHAVANKITLFNSVFISDQCVAKIPLLIKDGRSVQLYFIQSKVINPNKHRLTNQHGQLHKKWKQYIYDAAYQQYIIQQCYPDWNITSNLMLPDKTGKATLDKLNKQIQQLENDLDEFQIIHTIDIGNYVTEILNGKRGTLLPESASFGEMLDSLKNQYFAGKWNPAAVGKKCKSCEFRISNEQISRGKQSGFNQCWLKSPEAQSFSPDEPHVFELIGPGVNQWLKQQIYLQKNVPLDDLPGLNRIAKPDGAISHKDRQVLQVMKAKGRDDVPEEIIKPALFEDIDRWEYPVHFLDFEAGNYAVPIRKNRAPYHLVIFQFSCHTLHRDGHLHHHEWIARAQEPYPNYVMARGLRQVPDIDEGTIVQYSNFERTALKMIRDELEEESDEISDAPALIGWLESVIRRNDSKSRGGPYLADLSRLVKQFYYNQHMADSLSIKDVVQSVLTISEPLKQYYGAPYNSSNFDDMQWWQWDEDHHEAKNPYHLLRAKQSGMKVGRGTEAMVTFGRILSGSLRTNQQELAIKALLQYCELDTLAMVMIYQHWKALDRNG